MMTKLDLTGLKCPLPALKTRKALKSLRPGERLEVQCTDPLAVIDIPNLLNEIGDSLESTQRDGDRIVVSINEQVRRGDRVVVRTCAVCVVVPALACQPCGRDGCVVEVVGVGGCGALAPGMASVHPT